MPENRQLKDGGGNLFGLRMHDVSPSLDGSLMRSMFLATPFPIDYAPGGMYQYCAKSGVMLANMAASAPIFSFRWAESPMLAAIWRARLVAWSNTAFAAGVATFDTFIARQWGTADSGEVVPNFAGDASQLRASMNEAQAEICSSLTVPIVPGTRTLDPYPVDSRTTSVPTTATTPFGNTPLTLFEKLQGEHPLILALDEGIVVRATVPPNGAWQFSLTLEWNEIAAF